MIEYGLEVTAVVQAACRCPIWHSTFGEEVAPAQINTVDPHLTRRLVYQPLDDIGGLLAPGSTVRPYRRSVRHHALYQHVTMRRLIHSRKTERRISHRRVGPMTG